MIRDLRLIAYFRQCLPRDFPVFSYDDLVQGFAAIDLFQLPLSKIQVIDLHCQVTASPPLFRSYSSQPLFSIYDVVMLVLAVSIISVPHVPNSIS